jgi:hypothetical protein
MADVGRPSDPPILGRVRRELGERRMEAFVQGQANLQAMSLFLVMSMTVAPRTGYADDALDCVLQDIDDMRRAAEQWAKDCAEIVDCWRAQRQELEP